MLSASRIVSGIDAGVPSSAWCVVVDGFTPASQECTAAAHLHDSRPLGGEVRRRLEWVGELLPGNALAFEFRLIVILEMLALVAPFLERPSAILVVIAVVEVLLVLVIALVVAVAAAFPPLVALLAAEVVGAALAGSVVAGQPCLPRPA